MESYTALENFVEHWRYRPGFLVDYFGNATFLAAIRHDQSASDAHRAIVVRIRQRGDENGRIMLQKDASLFAELPHLDFSPPWHNYQFNGIDGELLINGHSERLDRPFSVLIKPA